MKNVVFMGTPDFAVPPLKALFENGDYDVKLVISQPDKPQGRHQVLTSSPVKELALQYNAAVFQPDTLKTEEAYEKIARCSPDFIVVSAYGKILPRNILDLPVYGCVNLHGSLLPKYRGAAPIQWSVINGEKTTGVTSMLMDAGLDTGDILFTSETEIGENETAGELFGRLSAMCPELLLKTLDALYNRTVTPVKQNEKDATYVSVLSKEISRIDWNENAQNIHNLIRGLNPWPVAKSSLNGKLVKIYSGLLSNKASGRTPGTVFVDDGRLFVSCGMNSVYELCSIQLEGGRRISAAEFLRGHNVENCVLD